MTTFGQIDLLARGGAISLFLLWGWILWRDHRSVLTAKVAMAMIVGIICYLLVTARWGFFMTPMGLILAVIAGATPGLFWLFSKVWFNDAIHLRRRDMLIVLASALNIVVMQLSFRNAPFETVNQISGILFRIGMLAFAGAGLWEAWRGRSGDLVEGRRRLRPRIIVAVGAYVILIAIGEVAVFNAAAPRWIAQSVGSSIVFVTLPFCGAMFAMRQADLFGPATNIAKRPVARPPDDTLVAKLERHIEASLAWRDETLTIAALAAQLGEQEYRLRRAINGQLGHRNFAACMNGYRLAEVRAALADPAQNDVPIITIALDAGFGSLGPFNRAFREAEGMTPSEYRAAKAG
ncbi:MAG TPA: AraC family transcriptional regulator [Sphingorhabdus sp.]|nr:AraC family transcriptional regulator [Sphingorhabdus sp.]